MSILGKFFTSLTISWLAIIEFYKREIKILTNSKLQNINGSNKDLYTWCTTHITITIYKTNQNEKYSGLVICFGGMVSS